MGFIAPPRPLAFIKQEDLVTEALLIDTLDVAEAVEKGTDCLEPRPKKVRR